MVGRSTSQHYHVVVRSTLPCNSRSTGQHYHVVVRSSSQHYHMVMTSAIQHYHIVVSSTSQHYHMVDSHSTLPCGRQIRQSTLPHGSQIRQSTLPRGSQIRQSTLPCGRQIRQSTLPCGSQIKNISRRQQGLELHTEPSVRWTAAEHWLGDTDKLNTCHFAAAAGKVMSAKPSPAHSGKPSTPQQQSPGSNPQAVGELRVLSLHRPTFMFRICTAVHSAT